MVFISLWRLTSISAQIHFVDCRS